MKRDGWECGLCLGEGEVVHHLKYNLNTMKGITLDWLLTLCHGCHSAIEFDGKQKSSLTQANKRLCLLAGLPYDKVNQYGMRLDLTLVVSEVIVHSTNKRRFQPQKNSKKRKRKANRRKVYVGCSRDGEEEQ